MQVTAVKPHSTHCGRNSISMDGSPVGLRSLQRCAHTHLAHANSMEALICWARLRPSASLASRCAAVTSSEKVPVERTHTPRQVHTQFAHTKQQWSDEPEPLSIVARVAGCHGHATVRKPPNPILYLGIPCALVKLME
jgi:hypothetical protein